MSIKHLHIEDIMRSTDHDEQNRKCSSTEQPQPSNDGRAPQRPYTVPASSLPPGVQQGLLLPPQTRRSSDTDGVKRSQFARSNLSALLESHGSSFRDGELMPSDQNVSDTSKDNEADSASGPSRPSPPDVGTLSRSAPLDPGVDFRRSRRFPTPPDALPPSSSPSRWALSSSIGKMEMRGERLKNNQPTQPPSQVRRCISSKELGGFGVHTGSPYSTVLHQREVIQATLQQRLMEARRSLSNERMLNASVGPMESSDSSETSKRGSQSHLNNETRNIRRAEHTKAVTNDLCEIVTDLFISEAKLLKPSSYGFDTSSQRDQVLKHVVEFVSSLPPRYALGVDTPSEVLLHMRLVAAARMDHSRTVVHVTNIKGGHTPDAGPSIQLVTISCIDALGLLEYITKILGSGGSRVLDADVMLNTDNIVLVSPCLYLLQEPLCLILTSSFVGSICRRNERAPSLGQAFTID